MCKSGIVNAGDGSTDHVDGLEMYHKCANHYSSVRIKLHASVYQSTRPGVPFHCKLCRAICTKLLTVYHCARPSVPFHCKHNVCL